MAARRCGPRPVLGALSMSMRHDPEQPEGASARAQCTTTREIQPFLHGRVDWAHGSRCASPSRANWHGRGARARRSTTALWIFSHGLSGLHAARTFAPKPVYDPFSRSCGPDPPQGVARADNASEWPQGNVSLRDPFMSACRERCAGRVRKRLTERSHPKLFGLKSIRRPCPACAPRHPGPPRSPRPLRNRSARLFLEESPLVPYPPVDRHARGSYAICYVRLGPAYAWTTKPGAVFAWTRWGR